MTVVDTRVTVSGPVTSPMHAHVSSNLVKPQSRPVLRSGAPAVLVAGGRHREALTEL